MLFSYDTGLNMISNKRLMLPATTLMGNCYYGMFYGNTSLEYAPELPALLTANDCYRHMFQNCTSLEKAPDLRALSIGNKLNYRYYDMLRGCSKLNYIKMLATNLVSGVNMGSWVAGVASSGTFVKNCSVESFPNYVVPNNWTVECSEN